MPLKEEIELNRDFENAQEAVVLSLVFTHDRLMQLSSTFLKDYDLNTTQFNALVIVRDYEDDGIMQFELSRRLLINRASTGTVIDKLEQRGLLERIRSTEDRRAIYLELTDEGHELLKTLLPEYYEHIRKLFSGIKKDELHTILSVTERIREGVSRHL